MKAKDCVFLSLVSFLLFSFIMGLITLCAKAQAEPIFFTLNPKITQYVKMDKKGLSIGARATISKNFLKTYKILQNSYPLSLRPRFAIGGSYDYNQYLNIHTSGSIGVLYNNILGLGSNMLFKINQEKEHHIFTSLYFFGRLPLSPHNDKVTVLYLGVKGKDIDFSNPINQFIKLSGEHINFFIGLNYNLNIIFSKISLNIEQHITSKEFYMGFNFGF